LSETGRLTILKRARQFYRWHWYAAVAPVLLLLVFVVLRTREVLFFTGPAWVLPLGNTLFIGLISFSVLGLYLKQVKKIGSWQVLLLVNGFFIYGLAALIAGWSALHGGQNLAITIHNLGALLAAVSLSCGSIVLILNNTSTLKPQGRFRSYVVLGLTLTLMLVLTVLAFLKVLPPFFPAGSPPTFLRQVIIIVTDVLFIKSTVIIYIVYFRSKVTFVFWYASGLLMITLGLMALPFILDLGDPLTWLGRLLQYIGCLYLGIAVFTLVKETRSKQNPVTLVLEEYLAQSKVNYQLLVDSLNDAVILVDNWGRILSWNQAAVTIFGYSRSRSLGTNVADIIVNEWTHNDFRPDLMTLLGITEGASGPQSPLERLGKRQNGQVFPCELVATRGQTGAFSRDVSTFTLVIRDLTERKKSQDALEASEARFRLALSSAPVSIAAQDINQRYLWSYNQSRHPLSTVIGQTDYDIFTEEDADRLQTFKRRVLETGLAIREQLWLTDNFQKRFIDLYLEPIRDANRVITGIGIAMVDLTQMKNAEDALRINNERLRLISETGRLLMTSEKPEKTIQSIAGKVMRHLDCDCFFNFLKSKAGAKIYLNAYGGVSVNEANKLGSPDYDNSLCGEVIKGGKRVISCNIQENGDSRLQLIRLLGVKAYACFPLQINQETLGTLSFGTRQRTTFSDNELDLMSAVTNQVALALERELSAQSLQQQEEMFRSLAENSPDVIFRFDMDDRILYLNPAGLKYTKQGEQPYLGKTIDEVNFPPNFIESWRSRRLELLTHHKPLIIEYTDTEKEEEIFYQTLLAPEFSTDGSVKSFISSTRNITDLKRVEKLKDEFIGMVSHELKTPLTVIIGSLAVAKTKGLPVEQANELITDAAIYADDLVVIVDNLLELSRFQSQRLTIQTEPTDLGAIARTVVQKLKNKSSKHHLVVDISTNTARINIDKIRIERVLYNLVENAIKYSPSGGQIRVFNHWQAGKMIVGVSDQGFGIAENDIAKLFHSFERIEAYEKHIIPGLGLGLRVCRILVEAHGGKIWVESVAGKGSTFYFSVPLSPSETGGPVTQPF
jgi:PAS domain S-box-containing protein